jgi:hypothetical protein
MKNSINNSMKDSIYIIIYGTCDSLIPQIFYVEILVLDIYKDSMVVR